jgi:hypothetical protein
MKKTGQRKKNKERMTIAEQLNAIAEEICDSYCKYPDLMKQKFEDPDEAMDYIGDTYCVNCPLYKNI